METQRDGEGALICVPRRLAKWVMRLPTRLERIFLPSKHCAPRILMIGRVMHTLETVLLAEISNLTQSSASCLIVSSGVTSWVVAPRKHLAFLSFRNSQATKTKTESAPFLHSPIQASPGGHQSRIEWHAGKCLVSCSTARTSHHTCWENEQETMIWSIVSGSCA